MSVDDRSIILTGASGFIGGEILKQLLAAGRKTIAALRGEDRPERLARRLGIDLSELPEGVIDIAADVGLAGLGNRGHFTALRGRVEVWVHAAGLTSFDSERRRELLRINQGGAVNAARMARDLGCERFVLISTAFLGGRARRSIPEAAVAHLGDWLTAYEESKFRAEADVSALLAGTETRLVVLRPSIVVNHSVSGFALNREHLHALWRPLHRLSRGGRTTRVVARLRADPAGLKNMIPVDAVARAAVALIENRAAEGHFNAVAREAISHQRLLDLTQEVLGLSGLSLVADWDNPDRLERVIDESLLAYRSYLSHSDPEFQCSRLHALQPDWDEGAALDRAFLARAFAAFAEMPAPSRERKDDAAAFVRAYLQEHLEPRVGRRLIPNIAGLDSTFDLEVYGTRVGRLSVAIEDGVLARVQLGPGDGVRVTFCVDQDSFRAIVEDRLAPVPAFLDGRVEIEGDVEEGLRLAGILSEFFALHPYLRCGAES